MKRPRDKFILMVLGLLASGWALRLAAAAEVSDILSPPKRQEIVDQGKKLLAPREIVAVATNPFFPDTPSNSAVTSTLPGGEAPPARPANLRSDRELIEALAAGLKPTGNFVVGGQPTLFFGQKRVKAGGLLTITFEGAEYTLEVTAIERTTFTLRLNREVYTRPIK